MAAEEVEREGQRGRRGLVPGEQEDQRLVADLLDVHRLAALGIAGSQQPREEILVARGSRVPPARDQLIDDRVQRSLGARRPAVVRGRPRRGRCQRRHGTPEGVLVEHRERPLEPSPAVCVRVNSGWTSRRWRSQSSPSPVSSPRPKVCAICL
jgi:hypothetical protein